MLLADISKIKDETYVIVAVLAFKETDLYTICRQALPNIFPGL